MIMHLVIYNIYIYMCICIYIYDLNHNHRNDETMATHGKQKATTGPGTIKSRLHQFIQSAHPGTTAAR